ncbi:MAG: site-specific integrase [Synergistaceae bacterium]|jgi:integrase|nr:site-specific integrase [Synergistaceae bacterium]
MKIVRPIKDVKKIESMKLILKNQSIRDLLLFVMGINTALRVSDLLTLTVGDVRDNNGVFRNFVRMKEGKTGKLKEFPLNDAVLKVLREYVGAGMESDRFLFLSAKGGALSRVQAYRILNEAAQRAGIDAVGTHTLRKTFGYHTYRQTRNLGLVQKLLNHSSSIDTLRYIGIEQEDLDAAYLGLNL